MITLAEIGSNLSKCRKAHGYTQEALANDLNMSACNIRRIEHGTGNPKLETLLRIADHLRVDVTELLHTGNIARQKS